MFLLGKFPLWGKVKELETLCFFSLSFESDGVEKLVYKLNF